MNKIVSIALAATLAGIAIAPAAVNAQDSAPAGAVAGKTLYNSKGSRVAAIYRVTQAGAVQVILEGKLVTVPNSSLTEQDGKVVTSLSKAELIRGR
ncbi:MAG: hypothetical protein ACKOPQ_12750 [Novosphingobium sp.]